MGKKTGDNAVKEFYEERGYHIERKLVSEDMTYQVVVASLQLLYKNDDTEAPLIMPHRVSPVFMSMLRYKPVVDVARKLLDGPISGLGTEYFYCAPGTRGFLPHQDNLYVQAPPGAFLHAWTALVDVTPDNGCLVFWPGSHKLGLLPVKDVHEDAGRGQNAAARSVQSIIPDGFKSVMISLKRGDTVFFDSLLVHASLDNESDRHRNSVLGTYIKKGAPFNPGQRQKRVEIEL